MNLITKRQIIRRRTRGQQKQQKGGNGWVSRCLDDAARKLGVLKSKGEIDSATVLGVGVMKYNVARSCLMGPCLGILLSN